LVLITGVILSPHNRAKNLIITYRI
jgi:hypothetical protein